MKAESSTPTGVGARAGTTARSTERHASRPRARAPRELAVEVATVLAGMSYVERVRAYRSGALSARELATAAGWFPEEMPLLNGEYEWIAISLVDLE
jgi:hypothetical protein